MIYGVTGLLGGGKSYGSVWDMVQHIKAGGIVASNIELKLQAVADFLRVPVSYVEPRFYLIDPDTNPDCWSWPRGDPRGQGSRRVLIVIDEAGEWFSALDQRKEIKSFASWLRQSDKRGQDVYLIVQDASILAKQGRVLVHRWLFMQNMEQWKIPKLGWRLPPPWRYEFHRRLFDSTAKNLLKHDWHMRETAIFGMYDTGAMFGGSAVDSLKSGGTNVYECLPDFSPPRYAPSVHPFALALPSLVPWLLLLLP